MIFIHSRNNNYYIKPSNFIYSIKIKGLDVVVVIAAMNKEHSFALLEKLNFPFIKKGDN